MKVYVAMMHFYSFGNYEEDCSGDKILAICETESKAKEVCFAYQPDIHTSLYGENIDKIEEKYNKHDLREIDVVFKNKTGEVYSFNVEEMEVIS